METVLTDHLLKELSILTNNLSYLKLCQENQSNEILTAFCEGDYGKILQCEKYKSIFGQSSLREVNTLVSDLKKAVEEFFKNNDGTEINKQLDVLLLGVACLQLFVQNNWLGPSPSLFTPKDLLPEELILKDKYKDVVERELSVDGEPVYHMTTCPEFLLIAKVVLFDCRDRLQQLQTADWWLIRCLSIQQQILDDKANSLRETFIQLIESVQRKEPLMVAESLREPQILFHLEAGYLSHVFYRYREAKEHFQTARKLSGLTVEFTGAMGKRTRYQETEKAQLILLVNREVTEKADVENKSVESTAELIDQPNKESILPKNLNLEDDTILDAINFSDDIPTTSLSAVEQSLIIGLMENHRRSRARDDPMIDEEMEAFITYSLREAKSWSVSSAALFTRSVREKKSSRRVDRSLRQIEELYNQSRREEPSAGQRVQLFYSVPLLPVWKVQTFDSSFIEGNRCLLIMEMLMQAQLAEILLTLGAIGSALEIYEKLQLWEDAIACYQRLGKLEKAETIIREQLAVKETPNLWCFLGDITRDISHYEKAWEMSNHRSARAQRCMAYLYFGKEEYQKCIECFQKSLNVNALQIPVWFTYGCAAMAAEDYHLAVTAFRRCVTIDYDNFEAWANMATAYVKLKEKKKAFAVLKDAIKCNYENWRLWDNMLLISTDCGEFREAIQAYHRLMDLRDKWEDEQVLKVLATAVPADTPDASGRPSRYLMPNLKELFGRITAKVTNNAEIWRLYAGLCEEDTEKSLQFLQRSQRCLLQKKDWEKKEEDCEKVASQSVQLADVYIQTMQKSDNQTQKLQMMSSAKLMLKGVLSKIKQEHTDPVTQELMSDKVKEMCKELENKSEIVLNEIQNLKS